MKPLSTALADSMGTVRALEHIERQAWASFYRAAPVVVREACGIRWSTQDAALVSIASNLDVLALNRVIGLGVEAPAAAEALDEIRRLYAAAGVARFFVQLSPAARPASLLCALGEHGFRHYNNWVKLYRPTTAPPAADSALRVEQIDEAGGATWATLFAASFGWPERVKPWAAGLVGQPGWHHYMAFDGDAPVATGAFYAAGAYAWLAFGGTLPEHRRRGAHEALLARRIRDAAALGCTCVAMETAEDWPGHPAPAFRNALRLGFQVGYVRPNYLLSACSRWRH